MKNKKLKLKPSAREKRRYFLVSEENNEKIEQAILDYVGILGFAKSSYMLVEKLNGKIIGSCLRQSLNDVRVALGMVGIKIERVSGTLKSLKRKLKIKK